MPNVNSVVLAGHATRDVEVRSTASGWNVCKFGLAVNNREKKGDKWENVPCFVDVTYFTKNSDYVANGLHKGTAVLVEGRLQFEQWDDKATGAKRSKLSVVADDVHLLGGKGERQTAERQTNGPAEDYRGNPPSAVNEDIPF